MFTSVTKAALKQLPKLVNEKNLPAIKQIVNQLKEQEPYGWHYDNEDSVERAVRNALMAVDYETAHFFISEAKVSPNARVSPGDDRGAVYPYIYYAVKTGQLPLVQLLVARGATIQPEDNYNNGDNTAIRTAIQEGHSDIAAFLLSKGAEPSGVFGGTLMPRDTYLARAAAKNDLAMVETLAQYGALTHLPSSFYLADDKYGELIRSYKRQLTECTDEVADDLVKKRNSAPDYMKEYHQNEIKRLYENKEKYTAEYEKLTTEYTRIINILMDYAVGCDFPNESYQGLNFLQDINIAGINFIGVSIGGKPVTHAMLHEKGFHGHQLAIVTLCDLEQLQDTNRKEAIKARLNAQMALKGQLIQDDIVNLIPLWRAAEIGDTNALKVRLAANGDPNEIYEDWHKRTAAIVLAAKNGHEDIIDLLVQHPAFNSKSLPEAIIAAKGHEHLTVKLMSLQNVDQVDAKNNTLLHYAVERGDVAAVNALIAKGANVNLEGEQGYPLHIAASHSCSGRFAERRADSHIELIKILLAHGANPDLLFGYYKRSALESAARAGNVEAMALLLPLTTKHAKMVKSSSWGDEPHQKMVPWFLGMMFESYQSTQWLEILSLLTSYGADIGLLSEDERDSLLHRVMRRFPSSSSVYTEMIYLRRSIAGCEDRVSPDMLSNSRHRLIRSNQREFMQHMKRLDFLFDHHVNVSLTTKENGNTPLHDFMKNTNLDHIVNGYARIIDKFLKQPGFDINEKNKHGQTVLHIAAENHNYRAVQYLISRGADLNTQDIWGNTPLHYAVAHGDIIIHACSNTTTFLVQAGASIDIQNAQGLTPFERSKKIQATFMETATYRSWEFRAQRELQTEWDNARLKLSIQTTPSKQGGFTGPAMQAFLAKCESKSAHFVVPNNLSDEDRLLIEMYQDETTQQLLRIPVIFNQRVYELDVLFNLYHTAQPDPFTQKYVTLSDIEPAKEVAEEIALFVQYLQEAYPCKNDSALEATTAHTETQPGIEQPIFAPGKNGIFGQTESASKRSKTEENPFKGQCDVM